MSMGSGVGLVNAAPFLRAPYTWVMLNVADLLASLVLLITTAITTNKIIAAVVLLIIIVGAVVWYAGRSRRAP